MARIMLALSEYPQLRLIAWNRRSEDQIDEEEAFALYESNWRFIEVDTLEDEERLLIKQLADRYGQGLLNV